MVIAVCIGCLVAVTVLAETTDFPEQQFTMEHQSESSEYDAAVSVLAETTGFPEQQFSMERQSESSEYDITRNELDTDDENSMEARKGKGYCVPSPYCSKNGYCVKKRNHCNGTVEARECCGSKKCFCCVPECSAPWKKIPGSGRCYLFSKEVGAELRDWNASQLYCEQQGGGLASAGYLPDTEADPLLTYIKQNGLARSWVSARKSGSLWKWSDERIVYSNVWYTGNPSGDGDCVEILSPGTLNDLPCTRRYDFVCEKE